MMDDDECHEKRTAIFNAVQWEGGVLRGDTDTIALKVGMHRGAVSYLYDEQSIIGQIDFLCLLLNDMRDAKHRDKQ